MTAPHLRRAAALAERMQGAELNDKNAAIDKATSSDEDAEVIFVGRLENAKDYHVTGVSDHVVDNDVTSVSSADVSTTNFSTADTRSANSSTTEISTADVSTMGVSVSNRVASGNDVITQQGTALILSGSPMERCFATSKTSATILGYLECRNIFAARRVCREWKVVFETAASVQSRLYASNTGTLPSVTAFVDNKLLGDVIFRTGRAWYARHSGPDAVWARREASWRQLQLCAPPVYFVSVGLKYFKNPRHESQNLFISKPHGVTLGDLWELIMQTMRTAGYGTKHKRSELDRVVITAGANSSYEWPGAAIG